MKPSRPTDGDRRAADDRLDQFRAWLGAEVAKQPRSLNAIEAAAGIPGNALGKFLRGERGRQALTPLNIRRLSPVLAVSEGELFNRAGHLSRPLTATSVEAAIEADEGLDPEDRVLVKLAYRRLTWTKGAPRAWGPDRSRRPGR